MNAKKVIVSALVASALVLGVYGTALAKDKDDRVALSLFGSPKPAIVERLFGKRPHLVNAMVTGVSGTTLTVTVNGKTYTILTDSNTKFRRKFWGKGLLSDISVNDRINVIGTWTDSSQITIQASLVRDLSVQKRHGVFFGTITSLTSNGFVMQTIRRGSQTVTITSSTKLINRKENTINQTDIKVGDKVRVSGLWDNTNSTITETTKIKDFSLPTQTQ